MDLSETSIVNATLWLLGCFSLLTWSIILLKVGEWGVNACRNYLFSNKNQVDIEGTAPIKSNFFR